MVEHPPAPSVVEIPRRPDAGNGPQQFAIGIIVQSQLFFSDMNGCKLGSTTVRHHCYPRSAISWSPLT